MAACWGERVPEPCLPTDMLNNPKAALAEASRMFSVRAAFYGVGGAGSLRKFMRIAGRELFRGTCDCAATSAMLLDSP